MNEIQLSLRAMRTVWNSINEKILIDGRLTDYTRSNIDVMIRMLEDLKEAGSDASDDS